MSWLADRMIQYLYRDCRGHEIVLEFSASEDPPEYFTGATDAEYKRIEMLPYKVNLTFKVQFERNGLVAYKYDTGDGKPRVVSATRERYEKNLGNIPGDKLAQMKKEGRLSEISKSVTTKGYQETYKKVADRRKKGAV